MIKREILKEIDRIIKECWKSNIQKDYWEEYLLREDSLKCALYFHLRKKLDKVLRENSLRIYPEYYFNELKYTGGSDDATVNWIKNDLWKFKDYMNGAGLTRCQFYFAAIYESECKWLTWLDARSTNNWAKGRVTELVSGIIEDEMVFEVHSYNGMNKELNDEGVI